MSSEKVTRMPGAEEVVDHLPGTGKIHQAIAAIMSEVGGVGKTRQNAQQGYKFRGIADIKLACQPLMAKHGVHVTPHAVLADDVSERTTKGGSTMLHVRQRIEFRFYHADGSYFPCVTTGEAMDTGDKASNKAMSAALKYALDQTFCLPEEDPEADTEHADPEESKRVPLPDLTGVERVAPNGEPLTNDERRGVLDTARSYGVSDATVKAVLARVTGTPSTQGMTTNQRDAVVKALATLKGPANA